MNRQTCLVIDSHPMVRVGIKQLLEPEYLVEELESGVDAVEVVDGSGDIIVVIVEMRSPTSTSPGGTTTIRELLAAHPSLGIVAHGGPMERHAVREALEAGASAYVSKRSAPSALLNAVRAASEQEAFIDPAASRSDGSLITRRQREVLQLFANGLSTEETARRLGLSQETVRTHAKASLARLGARDRTHAVAIAIRGSLIE